MPKIRMLKTDRASPDGCTVKTYEAGTVHMVSDAIMMAFFENGSCEQIDIEDDAPPAANDDALADADIEAPTPDAIDMKVIKPSKPKKK